MALATSAAASHVGRRYWKQLTSGAVGLAALMLVLIVVVFVGVEGAKTAPSDLALADIPPVALGAYLAADGHCPGLPWNVIAGIGKVESNHGRVFGGQIEGDGDVVPRIFGAALNGSGAGGNTTPWPSGQWEGQWGLEGPWLRALGPMQFISPSWATFSQDGNLDGNQDPHNIFDSALAAAQLLCQSQGGEITNMSNALFSYNRSTEYGELVMHWARLYVALPVGLVDGSVDDLLNHPNIELHPRARGDAEAGIVDSRLVSALVSAAEDFTMYIGWFKTGHSECVGGGSIIERPDCTVSNHHYGRAADIGAIGFADGERLAVAPGNEAAEALTSRWGAMDIDDPLRPESLGSPWDTGVFHGHFTDGNHLDHLHVAWRSEPPPPPNIEATRHGIDELEQLWPSFQSSDWFLPVVLPARTTEVLVGPGTVQSVIDSASPSTRIVMSSGFYPPLRIRNATGLSIVGAGDGVVTVASSSIEHGAGLLIENSADVTVSGLSFSDSLWGIQVRNSSGVTIAGNTITGVGQEAIHVRDGSSNVTIQNNSISHTGLRSGVDPEQGLPYRAFGEGIYVGTGSPPGVDQTNNVTIVGNEIHHTSAEAIEVKPGAFNVTINRNIIHDTSTQTKGAVVIHVGDTPSTNGGISVRRNLIWNTSATSRFRDGNAIVVSGPAHVQANVIWDSQHRGILVQEVYGSERSVTVRRNVVFDTPMGDVVVEAHSPALTTVNVAYNLDGSVFDHERFAGGWVSGNRPTEALALLVSALDDDTVPIEELESVFAPEVPVSGPVPVVGGAVNGSYTVAQVIDGTIGAGDGSNPNEEAPMGRHEASLYLPQGWNWTQGPTRNAQWGQLGSGGSRYAEWRCAVIPEFGHTPPVLFRVNVRNGAYYQFVSGSWSKAFDVDLTGGNHGGYLGNPGVVNADPFSAHGHGQIQWRREADGSFSAPWNPSALFMHFWAGRREAPAPGQTAEFLTSEMRMQQPDGQTVDLSQVKVLYQCGVDYYSVTSGQGTKVPGPGIAKYNRLMEVWRPGLWVTLPANVPAGSTADFERWLVANLPPNVSRVGS